MLMAVTKAMFCPHIGGWVMATSEAGTFLRMSAVLYCSSLATWHVVSWGACTGYWELHLVHTWLVENGMWFMWASTL